MVKLDSSSLNVSARLIAVWPFNSLERLDDACYINSLVFRVLKTYYLKNMLWFVFLS